MDYKKMLHDLLEEANSQPCPFCGKMHHVELEYTDEVERHKLSYQFSDDACADYYSGILGRAGEIVRIWNAPFKDLP